MEKAQVLERIRSTGLIPVIRARSADEASQAVDAIQAGGVGVLEITMTVPGAVELILGDREGRSRAGWPAARLGDGSDLVAVPVTVESGLAN